MQLSFSKSSNTVKVLAFSLCLTAALAYAAPKEADFVRAAKANIERQLVDPGSVQYRSLFISKQSGTGELMLCGEFNAKNRMGGYNGFRSFISSTGSMVYFGEQIDALLPEYCGSKLREVK